MKNKTFCRQNIPETLAVPPKKLLTSCEPIGTVKEKYWNLLGQGVNHSRRTTSIQLFFKFM